MTIAENVRRRPKFTIGDRLRKARDLTDMDVREFADIIGVNRNTITNYERERTPQDKMKRLVIKQWALVTGVDYEWLRDGDDGSAPSPSGKPVDSTSPQGNAALAQSAERFTRNE